MTGEISANGTLDVNDGVSSPADSGNRGTLQPQLDNTVQQQSQEKFLSQSEVNTLIANEKKRAYQRGIEEAAKTSNHQANDASVNADAYKGLDQNQIRELVQSEWQSITEKQRQEAERQHWQSVASKMISDFQQKSEEAKKHIADYDDVMRNVDFMNTPGLFASASQLDNSAEVLYHLANNPRDIPALEALTQSMPGAASAELKRISDRLKQNRNAKNLPQAPNPIGRIDSDITDGLGDGTPQTVADFMKIYRG